MAVVAASSSESAPRQASEEKAESEGGERRKAEDDKEYQVMADSSSQESRVSIHADPESPTVVSVATIVLAGQAEDPDSFAFPDAPHQAPEGEEKVQVKADDDKVQTRPTDEATLQKVAAEMVVQVQKAAQEEAAAIVSADKADPAKAEDNSDAKADEPDCETGGDVHGSAVCSAEQLPSKDSSVCNSSTDSGVLGGAVVSDSPEVCVVVMSNEGSPDVQQQDSTTEPKDAGDSQLESASAAVAVTVCDSEQSESQASEPLASVAGAVAPDESSQGATTEATSQQSDASVDGEGKDAPVAAETETVLTEPTIEGEGAETGDRAKEEEEKEASSSAAAATENRAEEDEADTSQLQQFNKTYYDIAVVANEEENSDDDDADGASKEEKNGVKDSESTVENTRPEPEVSPARNESGESEGQPGAQSGETSSPSSDESSSALSASDAQLANGQAGAAAEDGEETKAGDEVTARCNGSHEPDAKGADSNDTIDAYLRLQVGVNDGKAGGRESGGQQ